MKIICVDGEAQVLNTEAELCRLLPGKPDVTVFSGTEEASAWLKEHTADVALLGICPPQTDGVALAVRIREKDPAAAIVFLAESPEYAADAFRFHPAGYLIKPVNKELLAEEIAYAIKLRRALGVPAEDRAVAISAHTFGEFDLFVNGRAVPFPRSKSKELLAYLIDRQGGGITRATASAVLWEDAAYDRSMQKQLDVIIRVLRAALESAGAGDIFEMKQGTMRVCPEKIDCDLYRFLNGDATAVNGYRGEYMSAYSWANMTEAFLTRMQNRM